MGVHDMKDIRLIISDVDDTLAPPFKNIAPNMLDLLIKLLNRGVKFFLLTGQSFANVFDRVIRFLPENLMGQIYLGYCNGAEVCKFEGYKPKVIFSAVKILNSRSDKPYLKECLRVIAETNKLMFVSCTSVDEFIQKAKVINTEKALVMYDDRQLQVSVDLVCPFESERFGRCHPMKECEVVRAGVIADLNIEFNKMKIDYVAIAGGETAIDIVVKGVNKGLAVTKLVLEGTRILSDPNRLDFNANAVEIWGDSFKLSPKGNDRHLSEALPNVKAICFRDLDREDFCGLPNLYQWQGNFRLSNGLQEYLLASDGDVQDKLTMTRF